MDAEEMNLAHVKADIAEAKGLATAIAMESYYDESVRRVAQRIVDVMENAEKMLDEVLAERMEKEIQDREIMAKLVSAVLNAEDVELVEVEEESGEKACGKKESGKKESGEGKSDRKEMGKKASGREESGKEASRGKEETVFRPVWEKRGTGISDEVLKSLGIDETFLEVMRDHLGVRRGVAPKGEVAVLVTLYKIYDGHATDEEIAHVLGVFPSTVRQRTVRLMEKGMLEYRNGVYELSKKAREILDMYLGD